jgi:hypothetical protein
MTRTTTFWLAAIAITVAALGAHAQDIQTPAAAAAPGPSTDARAEIDRNGDGKITKAEASADNELARRFKSLDTDNSGKLDSAEFARFEIGDEPTPAPESAY